jgi:hypothetical protein
MLACQKKKLELAKQSLDAGKTHIMKCYAKKEIMEVSENLQLFEYPPNCENRRAWTSFYQRITQE